MVAKGGASAPTPESGRGLDLVELKAVHLD